MVKISFPFASGGSKAQAGFIQTIKMLTNDKANLLFMFQFFNILDKLVDVSIAGTVIVTSNSFLLIY